MPSTARFLGGRLLGNYTWGSCCVLITRRGMVVGSQWTWWTEASIPPMRHAGTADCAPARPGPIALRFSSINGFGSEDQRLAAGRTTARGFVGLKYYAPSNSSASGPVTLQRACWPAGRSLRRRIDGLSWDHRLWALRRRQESEVVSLGFLAQAYADPMD